MAAYVDPRFRPTLWPGTVVPTPPVRPLKNVDIDGDWIIWPLQIPKRTIQLPEDFYLRELLELSGDDLEACATLMCSYGSLFSPHRDEIGLNGLSEDERERIAAIPLEYPEDQAGNWGGIHRDLVKVHVQKAQQAIRIWLACQKEGGLEELVEPEVTEEMLLEARELNQLWHPGWPKSLDVLRDFVIEIQLSDLRTALDAALGIFSIGVRDLTERYPTIYSVSFLQLYNHLVEGASVHRCNNDNCRRHFVRQRGRSEYGQHRTIGVKYCSRECARAQAQRELRRRRRTESESLR